MYNAPELNYFDILRICIHLHEEQKANTVSDKKANRFVKEATNNYRPK